MNYSQTKARKRIASALVVVSLRVKAKLLAAVQKARVHVPVGLSIGAVTPAEIAASIVAQLIEVRRTHA